MKTILKKLALFFSYLFVFPAYIIFKFTLLFMDERSAFPGWSQYFALIPGHTGSYLRKTFYSLTLKSCSLDCFIGFGMDKIVFLKMSYHYFHEEFVTG